MRDTQKSRVAVSENSITRQIDVPVIEATVTLTEAEVSEALVEYARVKFLEDLPKRKMLDSFAQADTVYDQYEGHTVTFRYEE